MTCKLVVRELPWQVAGLQQTASGYGSRLTSRYKVQVPGEHQERRVYVTCWSNSGTAWFTVRGTRYLVPESARLGEDFEPYNWPAPRE